MLSFADSVLMFKALSDETRLKIVDMLSCEELCACNILEAFKITQPTLSYHMKILTECGLVLARKDGSWMKYSLNLELIESLKSFLNTVTVDKADCACKR
jgi:ArsR family transcriptional regulator